MKICFHSLLLGFYVTLLLCFMGFGIILNEGFVSKASLTSQYVIVDGVRYYCKKGY
jgi:hypothetical protein